MMDPPKQTLTIANGQTESGVVNLAAVGTDRIVALLFTAPAAVTETINVQVSADGGTNYSNLQSGGADVSFTGGKALQLTELIATHFKLKATAAVGGARTIQVIGAGRR